MPRLTGLHAARQIRAHTDEVQVLMLSMHEDDAYFFDALEAGASGYVSKRGGRRQPDRRDPHRRGR